MGTFVVFEGGEGVGKSTQARIAFRSLSGQGYDVLLTREPGGTALGETVRRWVRGHRGLTPLTELLLFTAARAQHVEKVVTLALSSQRIVICDRFVASTVAYQGYGRGLDLDLISRLNELATLGLRPDLTVLLDMPVAMGLARKNSRKPDSFESEAVEFHERAREGYLAQASKEPGRWLVMDGTLERGDLAQRIRERIRCLL